MGTNISINPDTQLVIMHTRIRGVESSSEVVRDEREDDRHETERSVTRTVLSESEYKEAKRLESLVRAAVRTFAVHTPIGNVSDSKRVELLRARLARVDAKVAEHNKTAKHHSFYSSLLVLPVAAALGPEACRALCEEVTGALREVARLLRAGDVQGVRSWRARNRNLDSLMPELIAQALRGALEMVAASHAELNKLLKEGVDAGVAGESLDLAQLEVAESLILPPRAAEAA